MRYWVVLDVKVMSIFVTTLQSCRIGPLYVLSKTSNVRALSSWDMGHGTTQPVSENGVNSYKSIV